MNESGKLCHILIECSFSEKGGRGLKRVWERFCKKYSSCRLERINVPKQYYHKSNRDRSWNNIKSLTKYIYRTSSFADDPQWLHTFVMNKMNVFFSNFKFSLTKMPQKLQCDILLNKTRYGTSRLSHFNFVTVSLLSTDFLQWPFYQLPERKTELFYFHQSVFLIF